MHRSIALRLSRAMLVRRVGAGPLHVGPFRGFLLFPMRLWLGAWSTMSRFALLLWSGAESNRPDSFRSEADACAFTSWGALDASYLINQKSIH